MPHSQDYTLDTIPSITENGNPTTNCALPESVNCALPENVSSPEENLTAYIQNLQDACNTPTLRNDIANMPILLKFKETTDFMKSATSATETLNDTNWDEIYNLSASIMEAYTNDVNDILAELDALNREQFMWQESAFSIDSHRAGHRMAVAEDWMVKKQAHINHIITEFHNSANIITKTIESLNENF